MDIRKLFAIIVTGFFNICILVADSNPFWSTTELLNVEWRKGCLTTAYCASPHFRLTTLNHASTESNSISWTITEDMVQDQARPFISYWIQGTPSDLSVACEVIGSDPKYGFQRTCDYTPNVAIFRHTMQENASYVRRRIRMPPSPSSDIGRGKMVVELSGKCFNATITVQKHIQRCPWCSEIVTTPLVVYWTTTPKIEKARKMATKLVFEERLELVCITVLATICVVSATAFTCLLVAYLKQRSNAESRQNERTYLTNLMKVDSPFGRSIQTKCDSPWDQKRKFVHWASNKSNETVSTRAASSNDSSPKGGKPNDEMTMDAKNKSTDPT